MTKTNGLKDGLHKRRCSRLDALESMNVALGDRVRIDIPRETDPDYGRLHGEHGEITQVIEDDAGSVTGEEHDSDLYRVRLDNGETVDLCWADLRPPLE